MNRGAFYTILSLVTFAFSCKEPVDLFVPSTDLNILSVDGFISTDPGPHKILVTRSLPFDNESIFKINGVVDADVKLFDSDGNCIDLKNLLNGFYETPASFSAKQGESYQLVILINGKEYRSSQEKVPPPIFIDSIYFKDKLQEILIDGDILQKKVVEYFVDYTVPNDSSFGMLNWTGDYIYSTRFPQNNAPDVCYGVDGRAGFSELISTTGLVVKSIKNFHFESLNLNHKLDERHLMDVELLSITKNAYEFYSQVQNQLDLTGSVFDPVPTQFTGNFYETTDPKTLVFGYFSAFNISKTRVYFNINDINLRRIDPCYNGPPPAYCFDCRLLEANISVTPPHDWEPFSH